MDITISAAAILMLVVYVGLAVTVFIAITRLDRDGLIPALTAYILRIESSRPSKRHYLRIFLFSLIWPLSYTVVVIDAIALACRDKEIK